MRSSWWRVAITLGVLALALLAPGVLGTAPSATAGELNGEFDFARSDTSYAVTDRNGTFTGQVTWPAAGLPMAWSFRLSPALRAIASGPMVCDAGSTELPYSDHHVVPPDYTWHSTVGGHFFNKPYTLYGSCSFPVNAGGRPGKATVRFRFGYTMYSTE